jgi:hypothetical protein
MALADWFSTFCGNLHVQNAASISSRYKTITQRLNSDFWDTTSDVAHSLYVGSYGRNTAVEGFSDLDMIFELPGDLYYQYDKHQNNGQSALLQAVRTSMRRTYPSSDIGGDGQVVGVNFTDGMTFEVVPVFENKAGTYTYPDSNGGGSWKTTNPRAEIKALKERNDACNKNLVLLCRMMRAWKKQWDVPIGGLLIDTLAYQFFENYQYRDRSYIYYDWVCRDFFKWMSEQDEKQEWWRAPGSAAWVWGKELFQYKAKRCYNISLEAITHETANPKREWSAKQKWRDVFGSSFPD